MLRCVVCLLRMLMMLMSMSSRVVVVCGSVVMRT